jgi:hypothetical protein
MKQWLRRWCVVAVLVFALGALPETGLMTAPPAVSRANNGCGVGWYYDTYMRSCQPYGGPSISGCISASGRRGRISGGICVSN